MVKVRRALISVSDKAGLVDFARELNKLGVEILSTGGTAKLLRENNIPAREVSEYTGFPEMLDGRVKTLHPKIHGGLLAVRDNPNHMQSLKEHNIGLIDMVVVNLYPFEKTTQKPDVTIEEAVENIDIGGPSMLRSAVKNHKAVAVVCNPARYGQVIAELKENKGVLSAGLMRELAIEVFALTSRYDNAIYNYLQNYFKAKADSAGFPQALSLNFEKIQDLRYGENPHQKAAFYKEKGKMRGLINLKQLQGKELSFNNILDLNSALELVKEFANPAAVVVKHNNPCGVAEDKALDKAYLAAHKCDPLSAFGGIVALNRKLDLKTARDILKSGFLECVIAPGFDEGVAELFKDKKNLRLLELNDIGPINEPELKRVSGGLLLQDKDLATLDMNILKVVTKKKPTRKQLESLVFGWKVAKHVKSNAIILTQGTKTVGMGAGQMSRVDSVKIAKIKSGKLSRNSCLSSDAFFPKADAVIEAAKAGVKAIIQPGGSISDEEIIKACDKYKVAMVTTGIRHFKH
ncbi:MAG: bifunctional phosphoribosylaminoimidazolecarboxamide formyltransferase/IMP cyclohydrolase [Candidatus Omnitrophica bacterium]|nr:bifunctional phosphoribosylaminoimidazolecarboxamide formyltransferase/IMP cyclohydrolase [Candidatus Omnitrophota bacterium]MDD5593060.1 bifunctional phosphoribosylaminoimidazolecarboxamide formyltransferase/IMP cyclohydrolase [Candidatus Omnitrophota bacterium]